MSSHEASEPFGNKSPTKPRKSKKTPVTASIPEPIRDSSPQAVVESVPNPTDPTAEPAATAPVVDTSASVAAGASVRARVSLGGTASSVGVPAAAENSPAPQPPLVPPMMSSAAGTPNRSAAGTPRGDGAAGAGTAAPEGLRTPPRGPTSPPPVKGVVSPGASAVAAAAPSKRLNMELPPLAVSSMRAQASVGDAAGGADTSRATMDTARAGNTTPHGPVAAAGGVPASPGRGPNTPGRNGVPPPGWTPLPGGGYRCSNPNCKRVHYPNGTPIASPMRQGSTGGTPTGGTPTARAAPPAQQTGEAFPSTRAPVSVAVQRQGSVQAGTPVVGTPVGKDKLDNTMMSMDDAYALGYMGPRMPPLIGERTVYPLWVLCTALSVGLGLALIVTMSMLLAASSNIPRSRTLFVPVGVVMLLFGIFLVGFGYYCARKRVVQRTPGGYSLGGLAARGVVTLAMGAVFAFCTAVVVFGAVIHMQNRQRAPYDVDYKKLTGLQGSSVSISRDKDGAMTHIIAGNRNDAYFGLGFAEAQDRLFQLQFSRLVMRGLLAAEFGPDAYESDRLARTMNWVGRAELSLDSLDTTQRSYLDSMCAGINQYLAKEWVLPPEFAFMGGFLSYAKPAAFEPLDLVLSFMMFQFALTTNMYDEIQRWQFWSSTSTPADFSYAELAALFKDTHSGAVGTFTDILPTGSGAAAEATSMAAEATLYDTTLSSYRVTTATPARAEFAARSGAAAAVEADDANVESHDADGHAETKSGGAMLSRIFRGLAASNAWAARAASANVVGASDPHLAMAMPSVWYNVHMRIEDEDFDVWGSTMPGVPAVLNGRTTSVRWGNTMSMTDTADLFVTKPDATTPDTHYTLNGVSTKYDIRHEYIEVQGESTPRLVRVRTSSYGPDVSAAFKLRTANGAALCLSLPGLDEDLNSLAAFMTINTPANTGVATMQTLLQKVQAPALTTVYSDESGNMGATITGTHPVRASGHTGRVPILGDGTYDYTGTVPTSSMPTTTDTTTTAATFLFAANSNPTPTGFTPVLGYDYAEDYRAQLIKEKLAAAQTSSPASLSESDFHKTLQLDKTSGIWLKFFEPTIGSDAAFTGRLTDAGTSAWEAMKAWDGVASVGSVHPSRLWVWAVTMMSAEPLFAALEHVQGDAFDLSSAFARRILTNPTTRQLALCAAANNNAVTGTEACKAWAATAFSAVVERGSMEWGNNVATVNGKHPLLEGHVAGPLFGRYLAKGGDPSSIDSLGFSSKDGVRVGALGPLDLQLEGSIIPSVRWVYETSGTTDKVSHLSMPGGNSGQPYRAEYFNMAEDYQAGTYAAVRPITSPAKRKQTLEKKK